MEITENRILNTYNDFLANIVPFGSLDIRTAVKTALEVGEDADYLTDCVEEFMDSTETKLKDIDVVYCIYDAILQEARNEIDDLIGFDLCNNDAEIYTCGNYMATSYDYSDNTPEKIKQKLIENEIVFDDLSEKTQWFLTEIEVNY